MDHSQSSPDTPNRSKSNQSLSFLIPIHHPSFSCEQQSSFERLQAPSWSFEEDHRLIGLMKDCFNDWPAIGAKLQRPAMQAKFRFFQILNKIIAKFTEKAKKETNYKFNLLSASTLRKVLERLVKNEEQKLKEQNLQKMKELVVGLLSWQREKEDHEKLKGLINLIKQSKALLKKRRTNKKTNQTIQPSNEQSHTLDGYLSDSSSLSDNQFRDEEISLPKKAFINEIGSSSSLNSSCQVIVAEREEQIHSLLNESGMLQFVEDGRNDQIVRMSIQNELQYRFFEEDQLVRDTHWKKRLSQ